MENISHSGLEGNLVILELRVKWNDVQNLKKLQEKIRAVDFSTYKDQSKEISKEIGVTARLFQSTKTGHARWSMQNSGEINIGAVISRK